MYLTSSRLTPRAEMPTISARMIMLATASPHWLWKVA